MTVRSEPEGPSSAALIDAFLEVSGVFASLSAQSLLVREKEVTALQHGALVVLEANGPMRPIELTEALGIDPSSTTRLCDRLIRRHLVTRRRPATNRREVQIQLSKDGKMLLDAIKRDRREFFEAIVVTIPEEERDILALALRRVVTTAQDATD